MKTLYELEANELRPLIRKLRLMVRAIGRLHGPPGASQWIVDHLTIERAGGGAICPTCGLATRSIAGEVW